MMKPRVFVSSTFYDLKYIRESLRSFIKSIGYEPILFEEGDIPFDPYIPLDESCCSEVTKCHMLVLIIGGRYGSFSSETEESVTLHEYRSGLTKNIPIYVFIEQNVYSEYKTYSKNKKNERINYAFVDDVKVFEFIDEIHSKNNILIRGFGKVEDISEYLRDQWAGMFADYLKYRQDNKFLNTMSNKIENIFDLSTTLKEYIESIMKTVKPDNYEEIIKEETAKIESFAQQNLFFKSELYQKLPHYIPNFYSWTDNELYDVFLQSKGFKEFLKNTGVPENKINSIINHDKETENEFNYLKDDLK